MKKETVHREQILLLGLKVRTNNAQELQKLEGNIFPLFQRYFHQELAKKIPQRKKPGTTFCTYTEYESDHHGDYSYFIGEEVNAFEETLPDGFEALTIPAQTYAKFTTGPAPIPEVITRAWEKIWKMTPEELGAKRKYHTDFEIYDERAADHQNIVLDLFIGLDSHV